METHLSLLQFDLGRWIMIAELALLSTGAVFRIIATS